MLKPDHAPPHLFTAALLQPRGRRRGHCLRSGHNLPPEARRRLSQLLARVIARHSLPCQKEGPDD